MTHLGELVPLPPVRTDRARALSVRTLGADVVLAMAHAWAGEPFRLGASSLRVPLSAVPALISALSAATPRSVATETRSGNPEVTR